MSTILLTGATSGIGLSLFEQYYQAGYDVVACGRDQAKLDALGDKPYKTLCFDITEKTQIKKQMESVEDELDIAIFNAGNCRYIDDVMAFDSELFVDVINTNLNSVAYLLEFVLPKIKKGGQLGFVSSSATILPFSRSQAYGASKAGMDYLANSLRTDLKPHNIGVTLIHPGFIKTPLTDKNDFEMPFLMSSDDAAKRILKGVESKKHYVWFPKRFLLILKLVSLLPTSIWLKLSKYLAK